MRHRFRSDLLRYRFNLAWTCLPPVVQRRKRYFIRQVREVRQLRDSRIRCPDGSRYGPLEDGSGYTFYYADDTQEFCDILLSAALGGLPEAAALAVILHELAHAHDYSERPHKLMRRKVILSERRAWIKAVYWAGQAPLSSDLWQAIALQAASAMLQDHLAVAQ